VDGSQILTAPVVDGATVYVGSSNSYLMALLAALETVVTGRPLYPAFV
jgi:hypothetical protein